MMNDVRNLMGHLHTQMDYKEFDGAVRPPQDAWPILQRVGRMAPAAAPPEPVLAAEADAEPAARPRRASLIRALKRPKRSMLDRYASAEATETTPEDGRRLSLAEVFARLAAAR